MIGESVGRHRRCRYPTRYTSTRRYNSILVGRDRRRPGQGHHPFGGEIPELARSPLLDKAAQRLVSRPTGLSTPCLGPLALHKRCKRPICSLTRIACSSALQHRFVVSHHRCFERSTEMNHANDSHRSFVLLCLSQLFVVRMKILRG